MNETSTLEIARQPINGGSEESCDMIVGIDPMGRVTFLRYMNSQAAGIFGYNEKDVVGEQVTDFIIGADNIEEAQHLGRLYASEDAFRAPNRQMKAKSGAVIPSENYVVPSYDGAGKFTGHYGMVFFKNSGVTPVSQTA